MSKLHELWALTAILSKITRLVLRGPSPASKRIQNLYAANQILAEEVLAEREKRHAEVSRYERKLGRLSDINSDLTRRVIEYESQLV